MSTEPDTVSNGRYFWQRVSTNLFDRAGNDIQDSNIFTRKIDSNGPPSITITASEGVSGFTTYDAINLIFTSSESTNNFDASDVTCEGGELSNFSGSGTTYKAIFTPTGDDGEKTIRVLDSTFSDEGGNLNTNDAGEWILVFRHDSRTGYFSSDNNWAEAKRTNPTDPTSGKFSILDEIETLGKQSDGTYIFKLLYPENGNGHNIWSQNCNPVIESCTGTESDFVFNPIELQFPIHQDQSGTFEGLLTSGASAYLDGNKDARWWYAVRLLLRFPSLSLSLSVSYSRAHTHTDRCKEITWWYGFSSRIHSTNIPHRTLC